MKTSLASTVLKLRVIHLMLGMMFFYGIEQLFFNTLLHDSSARGISTISYTAAVILCEIPSGMFADKFGRRRSLLVACCALIAALIVCGLSGSVLMYAVGSALYGGYSAFYGGAAQALLYDALKEVRKENIYTRLQGQNYAIFLIGAAIANFSSGFIAEAHSIRLTYFISLVPSIVAFVAVWKLREAKHDSGAETEQVYRFNALAAVIRDIKHAPRIILFGFQFIIFQLLLFTVGEFGQVYILAFGVSTVLLGILWGIDALFAALCQWQAYQVQKRPRVWVALFCFILGVFMITRNQYGIAIFWLIYGGSEALSTVAEAEMQALTSSNIRATMLSFFSFAANLIALPAVLLYTIIYRHHGIFTANSCVGVFFITVLLLTLLVRPPKLTPTIEISQQAVRPV